MSRIVVFVAVFVLVFENVNGLFSAAKRVRKASPRVPATHCTFDTYRYNISQTWYPFLRPYGYMSCIKCVCEMSKDGGAKLVCKKNCKKFGNGSSGLSRSFGDKNHGNACTHKSTTHAHRSVWEESFDNLSLIEPNQCLECSCSDGFVSCAFRTCPNISCSKPVRSLSTCCKVCPGKTNLDTVASMSFRPGCSSLGRHYREQEEWHPLVSQYKTQCIKCKCKNSTIRCSKVECNVSKCLKRCCKNCPDSKTRRLGQRNVKDQKASQQPKLTVRYPYDCVDYSNQRRQHGSRWKPIIDDVVVKCIQCTCQYSQVLCSRTVCPSSYPCSYPVREYGECCKQCKGMPIKVNKDRLRRNGGPRCGSGKTWNVYEYGPIVQSSSLFSGKTMRTNQDEVHFNFVLESVGKLNEIPRIEIHSLRANETHKVVHVKVMHQQEFKAFMSSMALVTKPIGVIRDGRRRKVEEHEKKECFHHCRELVKALRRMIRIRSRRCRSSASFPPNSLLWLKEGF